MTTGAKICGIPKTCGSATTKAKSDSQRKKMMVAVFEIIDKQPKPQRHIGAMGSPHGASIKVCKGRLTSACNPGVCDCPDEACKFKKTNMQILKIILKYAIFGFAVEEAVRFGIWSDASKTDALTERYLAWARDFFYTQNKIQRTPQEIYDMARIKYNLKNVWNNIVMFLNEFIASIPGTIAKVPSYFFPQPEPDIITDGACELNKGVRDADD